MICPHSYLHTDTVLFSDQFLNTFSIIFFINRFKTHSVKHKFYFKEKEGGGNHMVASQIQTRPRCFKWLFLYHLLFQIEGVTVKWNTYSNQ